MIARAVVVGIERERGVAVQCGERLHGRLLRRFHCGHFGLYVHQVHFYLVHFKGSRSAVFELLCEQGEEFFGIAELIHNHQVKRVIATHVGMTPEVGQQHTEGTLEVNLLPQGTLAECIRAAGAGLGGVLTPVGIDTLVEESPFCLGRHTVDGKDYLLMKPIHADFALLGAYKCDEYGNCWYKGTMRNFNVVMATAADTVIAECEYIVPVGDIEPENFHTYGMCVNYIVEGDRK